MKCPKCEKAEVKEQISIKGFFFFKKKEVYIYCPLCNFENKKVFTLSKEDVEIENKERLNLPKKTIQEYKTERRNF